MLPLLRMRLHHTIGLWRAFETATADKDEASGWGNRPAGNLMPQAIPIKRISSATSIVYVCAIAHQLATYPDQAATIAAQLVTAWNRDLASQPEPMLQSITIQATSTGFLHFEVGDRAIAAWLDQLLANTQTLQPLPTEPLAETERQLILQAPALFEAQHAYARCCSLLQLAHHESLIHLDQIEASPQNWQIQSSEFQSLARVPWLTPTDQLNVQHPVDRALIAQLLDAYDHLFDRSRQRTQMSVLRSAQAIAHAFQTFHRAHPLWEKAYDDSAIFVTRLGLLMITQRVLHLLLWDGLKLSPAVKL